MSSCFFSIYYYSEFYFDFVTQSYLKFFTAQSNVFDASQHIKTFADTAALIACTDLVISVDTSVAHLAGAMAKPLWVLLPHSPDWRWMMQRSDSPWYPTARLFRQQINQSWDPLVSQVCAELALMRG